MSKDIQKHEPTIDSREVAGMVDMRHADLCRKIQHYTEVISTNAKLRSLDFFIPSTYTDKKGEARTCYDVTRKGCEMIANKLTGEKGILFTAEYVERFNKMEAALKDGKELPNAGDASKLDIQRQRVEVSKLNARTRNAKLLADLAKETFSNDYHEVLIAYAANTAAGKKILELPEGDGRERHGLGWFCVNCLNRKETWASQLGKVLKENGIDKVQGETGKWVEDKAKNSNRQVQAFEWYADYLVPVIEDFTANGILTKAVPLQDVLNSKEGY